MKIDMSICVLATIIMAVLKLTEVISWSWWIVTAPVTIAVSLTLLAIVIVGVAAAVSLRRK